MGRPARTRTQTARLDHHEHPTATNGHDTLAEFREAQRRTQESRDAARARTRTDDRAEEGEPWARLW